MNSRRSSGSPINSSPRTGSAPVIARTVARARWFTSGLALGRLRIRLNIAGLRPPREDIISILRIGTNTHQIERSLLPLLRVVDQYGIERKDRIRTEIVFLTADRLAGEQRVRAAAGSLKFAARTGLSPDGAEGPGNYGLNKVCLMTIVTAKDNKVVANFALVQPGIADAPKIIAALAKTCGDENPPAAEALGAKQPGMARGAAGETMRKDGEKPKDPFPGAVPTDEKLAGLLRQFIRPTNDDATVDRLLAEVKTHIKDQPDLAKQAADGWTRILYFGDHYGTPYSRKVGKEFLDQLKTP